MHPALLAGRLAEEPLAIRNEGSRNKTCHPSLQSRVRTHDLPAAAPWQRRGAPPPHHPPGSGAGSVGPPDRTHGHSLCLQCASRHGPWQEQPLRNRVSTCGSVWPQAPVDQRTGTNGAQVISCACKAFRWSLGLNLELWTSVKRPAVNPAWQVVSSALPSLLRVASCLPPWLACIVTCLARAWGEAARRGLGPADLLGTAHPRISRTDVTGADRNHSA